MKKTLTLIALLLSFVASQADEVVVDGIKYYIGYDYDYYGGNGYIYYAYVYAYDSSDDYANNGQYYKGDITIPNSITYNGTRYDVTGIESYAFKNCTELTSISLPSSVTYISEAFYGCTSLATVNIPNSVSRINSMTFFNCSSLKEITIPASVNYVGGGAFSGCTGLKKVVISDSNNEIIFESLYYNNNGYYYEACFNGLAIEEVYIGRNVNSSENDSYIVFNNCKQLKKVTFGDQVSAISRLFDGCSSLTSIDCPNVTTIGSNAFYGCSSLASIDCPNVTSIGNYAFYGCSSLASIDIPNVTSIGNCAFQSCSSLASIDCPNVTSIGSYAFEFCSSLVSIDCPNVTSIGGSAFESCSSLTSIDCPNVTSIGSYAFESCSSLASIDCQNVTSIGYRGFYNCGSLASIDCPYLTTIDDCAFGSCYSLASIDCPNVTSIGSYAFESCSSLASIDCPNVTSIGSYAFESCSSLASIDCPNVTSIRDHAFQACSSLASIDCPNVTSIGSSAFESCSSLASLDLCNVTKIESDAFRGTSTILRFGDNIPSTTSNSFNVNNLFIVPDAVYGDYCEAWTDYRSRILSDASQMVYSVEVEAKATDSDVLTKVLNGGPESKTLSVVDLKVKGSINSYDIMVMRNKMINLRNLDLSEADIVANSYEYYTGYHSTDSVIGAYSFYNLNTLKSVKLPNSVKSINGASFANCGNLESVVFGEDNKYIEDGVYNSSSWDRIGAFSYCYNLKEVKFNDKLTYIGGHAFYNDWQLKEVELSDSLETLGNYAFSGCSGMYSEGLKTVKMGQNLKSVGDNAFSGCRNLTMVIMGPNLEQIGPYAFSGCSNLKDVTFSPSLTYIGSYGFSGCSALETIMLPTSLQTISNRAFQGCSSLKNVRIPASITEIGDYAFNTSSITDIYTWTIEPTNINQNTFNSTLFTKAMLHVPETSSRLYYWDTQWSQFLNTCEFNEPYTYFYLHYKDHIEYPETPRIEGEDGKNPDADILPGGGLIVDGDPSQDIGNGTISSDGDNAGTIIGGDSATDPSGANVNIDNLTIKINIVGGKWYFFAFPFDIELSDVHFDGQYVWRYYDGEYRAIHGNNAWKDFTGKIEAGKGYIFQASKSGVLSLKVGKVSIGGRDKLIELVNHASSNLQNASWNFVGNPFTSYYQISDLDYSSPITVWNGSTYTAYNPLDDDVALHPFQAFFVQKPDANTNLGFNASDRITKNQSVDPNFKSRAKMRRMAKADISVKREIVNIEVSDGNATDMARVVFNEESLGSYELTCDASKFMSADAPQIYTNDATNTQYAINERPMGDGIVRLGFTANHSGVFTISATRLDCPMWLKDMATGAICDLSAEGYEFTSDAGTFDDRFLLINTNADPTGIADIIGDSDVEAIYYGVNGMRLDNANSNGVTIVKKGAKVEKILNK